MCKTVVSPHRVKARKPHTCDWCMGRIEKGEGYVTSTLADGGYIYTWHECDRCAPYVDDMWHHYRGISPTLSANDFEDFMQEEYPEVLEEWWDIEEDD